MMIFTNLSCTATCPISRIVIEFLQRWGGRGTVITSCCYQICKMLFELMMFVCYFLSTNVCKTNSHLKPLICKMKNYFRLIAFKCSAEKSWVPAFMWNWHSLQWCLGGWHKYTLRRQATALPAGSGNPQRSKKPWGLGTWQAVQDIPLAAISHRSQWDRAPSRCPGKSLIHEGPNHGLALVLIRWSMDTGPLGVSFRVWHQALVADSLCPVGCMVDAL